MLGKVLLCNFLGLFGNEALQLVRILHDNPGPVAQDVHDQFAGIAVGDFEPIGAVW